jgi:hypothetical protein
MRALARMGIGADEGATQFGGMGWGSQAQAQASFGGMMGGMSGGSDFNPMMNQQGMQQNMQQGMQQNMQQGMQQNMQQGMQQRGGMQRQGMGFMNMGQSNPRLAAMGPQDDMHVLVGDDEGMDIDALLTNMDAAGQRDGFVSVQ